MKNKVVLVGAPGVGKTSFFRCATRRFAVVDGKRVQVYQPTIGAVYEQIQTYVDDTGSVVRATTDPRHEGVKGIVFALWDTAGAERYRSLLPMYLRGAVTVVVMHEASASSVARAKQDIADARAVSPDAKIFVVQSKSDMGLPFDYAFVRDVEADGWGYVCTISDNLDSVDHTFLAIAKMTAEAAVPETAEDPLELAPLSPKARCCGKI